MTIQSSYVRAMAKEGRINVTNHAYDKLGEREVFLDDVYNAIDKGEVIQIQNHGPDKDIRVVFQEATDKVPEFYVIVATSYPIVDIVSVCLFKDECWEWLGKTMARRE